MTTNFSVLIPKVINEMQVIKLDEIIEITSDVEKQDKNFLGNEKIFVEVSFTKHDSTNELFRLFEELEIDSGTGKPKERSRISFLKVNKFPDGCFYLKDSTNKRINCYICELKHRPGDKIKKISEQFYNGYIHCKTFFSSINLDSEYEINYKFLIVGYIKHYAEYEKQLISNGVTKASPGVKPEDKHKLRAYRNYKKGIIKYAYVTDYSKSFEFPIEFIQLQFQGILNQNTVKLTESKILSFT